MKLIYAKEIKRKEAIVVRVDRRVVNYHAIRGIYLEKVVVKRYYIPVVVEI